MPREREHDRSDRAKAVFLETIEKQASDWPVFLERACAGDAALRAEVEKLLSAHADLGSFHEQPRTPVGTAVHDAMTGPGDVIGPYKLVEQIGEGGFGNGKMVTVSDVSSRRRSDSVAAVLGHRDAIESRACGLLRTSASWCMWKPVSSYLVSRTPRPFVLRSSMPLVAILDWEARTWALLYFISEWLIRVGMLFVVPRRRSPQAANAWLALIFLLPWPGLIIFWLIGSPKMPIWRREILLKFLDEMHDVLARMEQSPHRVRPNLAPELLPTAELACRLGHQQVVGGNRAELLTDYDGTLRRIAADIDAAEDHVHLFFYIFADDAATAPIIEALGRAVQRGVQCRVLADALGSKAYVKKLERRLTEAGVQFHRALPYGLLRWKLRMDMRNHRKIVVIDGKVGYAGSQNLVDAQFKEGIVYEEMVARVEGPVVLQLQLVFAADWHFETREVLKNTRYFPDLDAVGAAAAQALPSGPTFPTENNHRLIVSLIHGSLKRVVITTPYLIPDAPLLQAMETAILRGVDVHLVVSEKMDQLLVGLAQESYYGQMLDLGVKIHRYRKKFLHAKHASFDDKVVFVGSSNMDIRSFQLNGEISLLIYDEELARIQRGHQERYFEDAILLTQETWACSRLRRMAQRLARLMSPLL